MNGLELSLEKPESFLDKKVIRYLFEDSAYVVCSRSVTISVYIKS